MQVFGQTITRDNLAAKNLAEPRYSLGTFWEAVLTVFIVMTGESWASIMNSSILVVVHDKFSSIAAAVYYLLVFIIGNYILCNLFVAILVDNFSLARQQILKEQKEQKQLEKTKRALGALERLSAQDERAEALDRGDNTEAQQQEQPSAAIDMPGTIEPKRSVRLNETLMVCESPQESPRSPDSSQIPPDAAADADNGLLMKPKDVKDDMVNLPAQNGPANLSLIPCPLSAVSSIPLFPP